MTPKRSMGARSQLSSRASLAAARGFLWRAAQYETTAAVRAAQLPQGIAVRQTVWVFPSVTETERPSTLPNSPLLAKRAPLNLPKFIGLAGRVSTGRSLLSVRSAVNMPRERALRSTTSTTIPGLHVRSWLWMRAKASADRVSHDHQQYFGNWNATKDCQSFEDYGHLICCGCWPHGKSLRWQTINLPHKARLKADDHPASHLANRKFRQNKGPPGVRGPSQDPGRSSALRGRARGRTGVADLRRAMCRQDPFTDVKHLELEDNTASEGKAICFSAFRVS